MKTLIIISVLALTALAHANSVDEVVKIPVQDVLSIQTAFEGYVTPSEIINGIVSVRGLTVNDGILLINPHTSPSDVAIIHNRAATTDLLTTRVEGGDMGGSRIGL